MKTYLEGLTPEQRERNVRDLAVEACSNHYTGSHGECQSCLRIRRVIEVALAAEAEACAQIADAVADGYWLGEPYENTVNAAGTRIAAAIRARHKTDAQKG